MSKLNKELKEIAQMRGQINSYYKNLGGQVREQFNFTYNRLNKLESHVDAIFKEIKHIKENLKNDREEFHEVAKTLVDSLKVLVEDTNVLPTVPQEEAEKVTENPFQIEG
ncbi:MAG: hypothetical protein JSV20_07225 [Candidatus Bathyarchaeota archaeon]|nr:MAG: hypothetical protein JSV20_07225 [Candidatus Bathyarchaeota archaeon]